MFLFFKITSSIEFFINKPGYVTEAPNNTVFVCIVNPTVKKKTKKKTANNFPVLLCVLKHCQTMFYISRLMNVYVFIWILSVRQMLSSALLCKCCSTQSGFSLRKIRCLSLFIGFFIRKHWPM